MNKALSTKAAEAARAIIQRNDPEITVKQLDLVCTYVFNTNRWGGHAAKVMGCSQPHISNIKTGKTALQPYLVQPLFAHARKHGETIARVHAMGGDGATLTEETLETDETETEPEREITDEEIAVEQKEIADKATRMISLVLKGRLPSLVISGQSGTGKSHHVSAAMKTVFGVDSERRVKKVSGAMSPPGLFQALYHTKDNGFLYLDDCDDIYSDLNSLDLLKAALDSTDRRIVSYEKEAAWIRESGVEKTFEYNGNCIFITNKDLSRIAESKTTISEHVRALVTRSVYIDMTFRSQREMAVKIKTLLGEGMLSTIPNPGNHPPFSPEMVKNIESFIMENQKRFRDFSIRTAVNVAHLVWADPNDWKSLAEIGLMKKGK